MENYRGDYLFACFRVCSHSVLDKINNEKRQTRCIVYGQQVQINYRSIFSGVKSINRKRNFHICKHVEANTFAAIRLDCTLDTFYYTITLASWICLLWAFCEKSCTMWYLASFLLVTCIELTKLLQCRAQADSKIWKQAKTGLCIGGLGNVLAASQRTRSLLSPTQKLWAKRTTFERTRQSSSRTTKQTKWHARTTMTKFTWRILVVCSEGSL